MVSHSLVQSCPDNRDREVLNSSCEVGMQRLGGRCVLRLWLCLHFLFINGGGIICTPQRRWWWCGEVDASLWGQSLPRQNLSHAWPFPVSENDWTVCCRVSVPKAGRTPLRMAQPATRPTPDTHTNVVSTALLSDGCFCKTGTWVKRNLSGQLGWHCSGGS